MRITFFSKLLVFLAVLSGCTTKTDMTVPDNIIPPDKMVDIMVDINLTDAIHNIGKVRSQYSTEELYKGVYKKHGISRRAFDESMRYYSQHHPKLTVIYERVEKKLKRMEKELEETSKEETNE